MPVIERPIEVTVTVWLCNVCGTDALSPIAVPSMFAVEYFTSVRGWVILRDETTVICDRCKILPDPAAMIAADLAAHT